MEPFLYHAARRYTH